MTRRQSLGVPELHQGSIITLQSFRTFSAFINLFLVTVQQSDQKLDPSWEHKILIDFVSFSYPVPCLVLVIILHQRANVTGVIFFLCDRSFYSIQMTLFFTVQNFHELYLLHFFLSIFFSELSLCLLELVSLAAAPT